MNRASVVAMLGLCVLAACSLAPGQTRARKAPPAPATQPAPTAQLTLDLGGRVGMRLVLIREGTFMMGSHDGEGNHAADEGPQHEVTISKPFYMGVYAVTQEQYTAVMDANPSGIKGAQNPVDSVSWEDAVEFCKKASQATGRTVTLPTEAQWEYACRAGTTTRFSFGDGDTNLGQYAWYSTNSQGSHHPVGLKKPNPWGLYDMHGNVWQWCSDWYADSYAKAGKGDPKGPATGLRKVIRGGAWGNNPPDLRSACRGRSMPARRNIVMLGFRVVVAVP